MLQCDSRARRNLYGKKPFTCKHTAVRNKENYLDDYANEALEANGIHELKYFRPLTAAYVDCEPAYSRPLNV